MPNTEYPILVLMDSNLPQPVNQNPYDFIMSSGQPPQKGRSPIKAGGGQLQRIIFVVAGALFLIIIVIVAFSVLSGGGKASVTSLKSLAADQTELIRVADLGVTKAKSTNARQLAATTSLSLKTMHQRTVKLLSQKGEEITPQEKNSKKDTKTDTALTAAEQNNRYDETLITYLTNALTNYQTALKTAYDTSSEANDRAVLSDSFSGTTLILENQLAAAN